MNCPCGQEHSGEAWDYCVQLARQLGEHVTVRVIGSTHAFRVSRLYIGMHGLRADELPALADRYGWEEVRGEVA